LEAVHRTFDPLKADMLDCLKSVISSTFKVIHFVPEHLAFSEITNGNQEDNSYEVFKTILQGRNLIMQ
jgi:hypothetical protein